MAKTIQFVPAVCKGETPTFSGSVTLKKMTFDEKYKVLENCGVEVEEGEGGKTNVKTPAGSQMFKTIRAMVAASKPAYVSVDLTRMADGAKFTSFDDLDTDGECDGVLAEIGQAWFMGFKGSSNP